MNFKKLKEPMPLKKGIYEVDVFNRNPLFVVSKNENGKSYLVSSWEESFSIIEKVSFEDINPHYLNALIRNQISTSISPYLNIKRVSRCQKVFVEDNGNFNFKEFIPFANALKDTKEKDLHKKIKSNLIDRLKSIENIRTKTIGCEHSSGLDSNAILGSLIYGLNLNLNNLNTFSFVSHGEKELLRDFRKFFKINKKNFTEINSPLRHQKKYDKPELQINDFGFPLLMQTTRMSFEYFRERNCNIIFSGLGGDQGVSNFGRNVPVDLILDKRFRELLIWKGNIFGMLKQFSSYYLTSIYEKILLKINYKPKFNKSSYLEKYLKDDFIRLNFPHYQSSSNLRYTSRLKRQSEIIKNQICNEWISLRMEQEERMATNYQMKMYHPFLNEKFIELFLLQDPMYFADNKKNMRKLHRSSFFDYLPKELRSNYKKERPFLNSLVESEISFLLKNDIQEYLVALKPVETQVNKWFQIDKLFIDIEKNISKRNLKTSDLIEIKKGLEVIFKINEWIKCF